ncbi:hypothetical protein OSTOST_20180, partial [Ostertagia ostertagi]
MEFLGAVEIEVELEGGRSSDVAFYIADSRDDEILLGTNSLSDLGSDTRKGKSVEPKSVTVAKRIYIPPHGARVVSAHCNVGEQTAEGVVWPTKEGLGCGIFKVMNQKLEVPVVNSSDKPMVLGKGEEIGQWGTEKWKEKWEEFNPCIIEDTVKARTKEQRRALLVEQTRRSSNVSEIFVTASTKIMEGRLFIEAGAPEASGQFFTNHVGAGVPKQAYEAARKKAVSAMLPILPDARNLTSRTMSTPGEGVWVKRGLPVKR